MDNNRNNKTNFKSSVQQEMKEAEDFLSTSIMEIEQNYDSIIADCVLVKMAFDRIAEIKQQGETHYLNDILKAVGKRLEEIEIPNMIVMEKPEKGE